jgi:phosphorylcholine metabolism protein LicD
MKLFFILFVFGLGKRMVLELLRRLRFNISFLKVNNSLRQFGPKLSSKTFHQRLFKFQKRAARIILDAEKENTVDGPSYTIPDSYRSDINLRCLQSCLLLQVFIFEVFV